MPVPALTYGYDLGGDARWNFRELDHNEEPRLFWYINGEDFYTEATAFLKATQIDVEIVRYGDEAKGVVGHILAASADVENGPVSAPFDITVISRADLAELDAQLTAALTALGITPTKVKFRGATPTPAKPGWITSAYQA
jgi:hypothetical protein